MRNGFLEWFEKESPDILCLQETRANPSQIEKEFTLDNGYFEFWNSAERKGYSGVAIFSKEKPMTESHGLGIPCFDSEGRVIALEFAEFTLLNIYFPHGQRDHARVSFKLEFCEAVLDYCEARRKQGKRLVICGDFNTSHQEIDLKNPKQNVNTSGFLPIERAWMDKFVDRGYIDIFGNCTRRSRGITPGGAIASTRERGTSAGASIIFSSRLIYWVL